MSTDISYLEHVEAFIETAHSGIESAVESLSDETFQFPADFDMANTDSWPPLADAVAEWCPGALGFELDYRAAIASTIMLSHNLLKLVQSPEVRQQAALLAKVLALGVQMGADREFIQNRPAFEHIERAADISRMRGDKLRAQRKAKASRWLTPAAALCGLLCAQDPTITTTALAEAVCDPGGVVPDAAHKREIIEAVNALLSLDESERPTNLQHVARSLGELRRGGEIPPRAT